METKLNLGCGRNIIPGWLNLDRAPLPGVDVIYDLERIREIPLPFEDNSIDEFLLSHVIEHLHHTLPLMQELHRVARPNAKAVVRVPHGATDDAWEDPTHVRAYFPGSFGYFSQPFYWRADYGYRGDWQIDKLVLVVRKQECGDLPAQAVYEKAMTQRNFVVEMQAEMRAIKPIREPIRELQAPPKIEILAS